MAKERGPYRTPCPPVFFKLSWWKLNADKIFGCVIAAGVVTAIAIFVYHMHTEGEAAACRYKARCHEVCTTHEGGELFLVWRNRCACKVPGEGVITYNREWGRE